MQIVCIGDIHLKGGHETDAAKALMKTAQLAKDVNADMVAVLGDVFDAKSTPEQRLVFRDFLQAFENTFISVKVIRGNHDEAGDLKIFDNWLPDQVAVDEEPGTHLKHHGGQNYVFYTIPHFNAGAVAMAADQLDDFSEEGTDLFSTLIEDLFQKIHSSDHKAVVFFHGTVSGAELDNGHIPRHNGIHLNLDKLATLGCPVIGGHYHKHQIMNESPVVAYTGSPARHSFGEAGDDKGVMILEHTEAGWSHRFVDLNPVEMLTYEGFYKEGEFWINGATHSQPLKDWPRKDFAGAKVRYRYEVDQNQLKSLSQEAVKTFFETAAELKIEQKVLLTTAVRSHEINEAESVSDCFKIWAKQKGFEQKKIVDASELLDDIINHTKTPDGSGVDESVETHDTMEIIA